MLASIALVVVIQPLWKRCAVCPGSIAEWAYHNTGGSNSLSRVRQGRMRTMTQLCYEQQPWMSWMLSTAVLHQLPTPVQTLAFMYRTIHPQAYSPSHGEHCLHSQFLRPGQLLVIRETCTHDTTTDFAHKVPWKWPKHSVGHR